jgi:predicted membrane protein
MTDLVSNLLTSFIVAIIVTIPIMVVIAMSGVDLDYKEIPFYQLTLIVWSIAAIIVFGFIKSNEPKMYEV